MMTFHTQLYFEAAKELGLKTKFPYISDNYMEIFNDNMSVLIFQNHVDVNSRIKSKIADLKHMANKFLESNNVPVPKSEVFNVFKFKRGEFSLDDVLLSYKNNNYKVIKPNDASKGTGVYIGLENDDDIKNAILDIFNNLHRSVLLEEFIEGNHFRILVLDGEIIDIVQRTKPNVIGDGFLTIMQLIDKKNIIREENDSKAIEITDNVLSYLADKNLTLNSVPAQDEEVELSNVTNFSIGADVKRISLKDIHPDNIELFKNIHKIFGLKFIGIDFICPNLLESYKKQKCAVNEVNKSPMQRMHSYMDKIQYNDRLRTAKIILSKIFKI